MLDPTTDHTKPTNVPIVRFADQTDFSGRVLREDSTIMISEFDQAISEVTLRVADAVVAHEALDRVDRWWAGEAGLDGGWADDRAERGERGFVGPDIDDVVRVAGAFLVAA